MTVSINITKLSTKRLLAYKRKHFPSENYPHFIEDWVHDCDCAECKSTKDIIMKYCENYNNIKDELGKRENMKESSKG